MIKRYSAATFAAALLSATAAHAGLVDLVTNGSFETGTNAPGINSAQALNVGATDMTGWTVVDNSGNPNGSTGNTILWIGNGGFGLSSPFGNNFVDLTGTTDSVPFDGVMQTLTTVAGQSYAITFDLGVQAGGGNFGGPITVNVGAGSATTTVTDTGTSGTTTSDGTIWIDETFDFTATSTSTLLSFIGETGIQFIGLDNVSVNAIDTAPVSPVPEPASILLLGAGLAALGLGRSKTV
jgi:hypothetical protein